MTNRESKEFMSSYLTRNISKHRDLSANLGYKTASCLSCNAPVSVKNEIPEVIWAHLLEKGAHL